MHVSPSLCVRSATNVGTTVFKEVLVEKKQQTGRSDVKSCVSAEVKEEL